MKTIGIDGCRTGWIAISLDSSTSGYWIVESDQELADIFEAYDRIFIDVPIGLEDQKYTRECDVLLREVLGPDYRASVFNPPVRPALHAPTYAEASMTSYEITQKKISIQAWNITPKIKAVDQLLQENESYRGKVYESHPELIFQNLNGGNPVLQKKETKKGLRHRLDLLSEKNRLAADFFRDIKEEYRRNQIGEDDIVDALALAWAANQSQKKPIKTLPENPPKDSSGLRMAIHYV